MLYVPLREVLRLVGLPRRRGEVDPLQEGVFEVFHLRHEMDYDALPCAEVVADRDLWSSKKRVNSTWDHFLERARSSRCVGSERSRACTVSARVHAAPSRTCR